MLGNRVKEDRLRSMNVALRVSIGFENWRQEPENTQCLLLMLHSQEVQALGGE